MFSYFLLPHKSCADIDPYIRPIFWPPFDNDLQKWSENKINKNKACEVSNHRIFGVPIPFWYPFLTSNDSEGILPQDINDLRYSLMTSDDSEGILPPDINDLWRSKYKINDNNSYEVSSHRFLVFQFHADTLLRTRIFLKVNDDFQKSKDEINENGANHCNFFKWIHSTFSVFYINKLIQGLQFTSHYH